MNDEEIRRVRRIIEGPPGAPPPVDPRQTERFQRALGAVRRAVTPVVADKSEKTEKADKLDRTDRADKAERSEPARGGATAAPPSRPAVSGGGQKPPPPVTAVRSVAARETAEEDGEIRATPVVHPPLPTLPAVNWTPLPDGWDTALVDTISLLCRSSDPNFHSWTILVPLNPETLPHTELRLTFSPHRLQLRFSTQSTRSLALVSAHHDALRDLLRQALPDDRHIDIDIT